jgi:hypothetical protein
MSSQSIRCLVDRNMSFSRENDALQICNTKAMLPDVGNNDGGNITAAEL